MGEMEEEGKRGRGQGRDGECSEMPGGGATRGVRSRGR